MVDDLKTLVAEAAKEAKDDVWSLNKGTCVNPSGALLWKKAKHSFGMWEKVRIHHVGTPSGGVIEFHIWYERKCKMCGKVESYRDKQGV